MKLVRVDHIRCGERSASDWAWCPNEWSEEEVAAKANAAQDAYLDALAKIVEESPVPRRPSFHPSLRDEDPSLTIGEVLERRAKEQAVFDEWQRERDRAKRSFMHFLEQQGFKHLWGGAATAVEVDWGHRHGQRLSYGTADLKGFPSPSELVTGRGAR